MFADNQLEIEIVTYNRSGVLKDWLANCLQELIDLNIKLAIYDSSPNDETSNLIKITNDGLESYKIKYVKLPSSIRVDAKVLKAILECDCEYCWPTGDSRCLYFTKKAPRIKEDLDRGIKFISIYNGIEEKKYDSALEFMKNCFWHSTWLGGLILSRDVFAPLKSQNVYKKYNSIFNRNDGFSYLGMFYNLISEYEKIDTETLNIKIVELGKIGTTKKPGWLPRYFEVWCDNLCYLFDNISDYYDPVKSFALKETWRIVGIDGHYWLYQARLKDGLTREIYEKYNKNGMIDRCASHKTRIKLIAYMPKTYSATMLNIYRAYHKAGHLVKQTILKRSSK